ncbi:MAG: FxsA family protein [Actinomycetota bacterium]|nr:FxsA family protein [Actinomycetota bacterium]
MLLPLVLLFVLVPIAELAIIIQVGQALGVWTTIAILVADSVLGSLLMRSQGRATWRRFNEALQTGRVPAKEVLDGGLVIFGGACLLTPGFITDLFGLALLLPPTRAVLRRLLMRRFALRMATGMTRGAFRPPPGEPDVEGTAREVPERRLQP